MPLDTIYLVRHGHRLNWSIDYKTGEYMSMYPSPTGNAADPTLTSHGLRQSQELAAHLSSPEFRPKPFRVYSSPFYRCLQTIQPGVEVLKERQKSGAADIEAGACYDVRIENGLGEWFGSTTFFDHPSPATPTTLQPLFPTLLPSENHYKPLLIPSNRGETIAQLHNRIATTLSAIIAEVDAEVHALESSQPPSQKKTSKAILISSHAAPLIAMGRALTGNMPDDSSVEDFHVFTAGLSTFVRRKSSFSSFLSPSSLSNEKEDGLGTSLAQGTQLLRPGTDLGVLGVPNWKNGKGVGGGWDCVVNGDCRFLSTGAERGWHFNGDESFDTGPMDGSSSSTKVPSLATPGIPSTKL